MQQLFTIMDSQVIMVIAPMMVSISRVIQIQVQALVVGHHTSVKVHTLNHLLNVTLISLQVVFMIIQNIKQC